ncbi:Domain of unknown function DUF3844 [Phaffia rhodozyma]|uniref:Vacuolar sorting protein Vps3844 C-terminal domain-containing protein n=1 Tax=Phaffia rhodozyma TaxID=264483 RepID=A0A0F7SN22_PHARH|nr:Domain of unknown function DUF3844 [Phaffia rhodozyma]
MLLSTLPLLFLSTLSLAQQTALSVPQVYLYPAPSSSKDTTASTPLTLTDDQARSVLAHHLGATRGIHLPEIWEEVEGWSRMLVGGMFGGLAHRDGDDGEKGRVLIVQGVENPLDITSQDPSFQLTSDSASLRSLLNPYFEKTSDLFKHASESIEHVHVPGFLLDLFDIKQDEATQTLHRELQMLSSWVFNALPSSHLSEEQDPYDAMSIGSLQGVKANSEEYKLAVNVVKGAVDSITSTSQRPFILILTPPSALVSSATFDKRALAPSPSSNSSFPGNNSYPAPNLPVYSTSLCLASYEACQNYTSSCNGRGSCVKVTRAGKSCYGCACGKSENGTSYGGVACEKKDISSTFTLLLLTSIFIVVLIAGSIGLLSTVGLDPLPSVLTGGSMAGPKRND